MTGKTKTLAGLWTGCWLLAAATIGAQAPAEKPRVRLLFENDRVRVIDVIWEPGAGTIAAQLQGKETIGIAGVVVRGGTMEHVQANGKTVRQKRRAGDVLWHRANTRIGARQNVGQTTIRVIQARLKKTAPTGAYSGPVAGVEKIVENARLVVFDQAFAPGATSPLHAYGPRVWVVLQGGRLRSTDHTGYQEEVSLRPAQWVWLPAQQQALENIGATPVRTISLELK